MTKEFLNGVMMLIGYGVSITAIVGFVGYMCYLYNKCLTNKIKAEISENNDIIRDLYATETYINERFRLAVNPIKDDFLEYKNSGVANRVRIVENNLDEIIKKLNKESKDEE